MSLHVKAQCFSNVFLTPDTAISLMEIGQTKSAAMQATAPVGSPECTFFLPRSTFGRPESAVACMGALLVCPISIKEGFCGVWGQKNVPKALVFIKPEAIMAESETSSSILIVWPTWEHYFGKVVLWR